MSKDNPSVVIYGTGGHARVVHEILAIRNIPVAGFMDREENHESKMVLGRPLFGSEALLVKKPYPFDAAVIAVGNGHVRKILFELFRANNIPIMTVIHPSAVVSPSARLGNGCCICAGAVIGPGSTVGDGVIINTNASVDHDCNIGNFVHIAPGATVCGGVKIGQLTFFGAGSTIIQEKEIGEESMIGAGSLVLKSVPPRVIVFGSPATERGPWPKAKAS